MEQFLQDVQKAMVAKGWSPVAAKAQIDFDPDHLLELQADGMTASDAAVEVERQYKNRHSTDLTMRQAHMNYADAQTQWSRATSLDGHRQCSICGSFVRDNGALDTHVCSGEDD